LTYAEGCMYALSHFVHNTLSVVIHLCLAEFGRKGLSFGAGTHKYPYQALFMSLM